MEVAILGGGQGWHFAELDRAFRARGHQAHVLRVSALVARIGDRPRLAAGGVALQDVDAVIVKPLFGSGGRGMVRVSDEEIAHRVFRALDLERAVYYVQEALPHEGRDIRALVVGERVVAAAWRCAEGWRTNVSQGARVERAERRPEWQD